MTLFSKKSNSYDKWYQTPRGAFIDEVETKLIFSMLDVKNGMNILDAGCGTGNFSIKLAEKGAVVTGIDISSEMMAIAGEKAREYPDFRINFRLMDMNYLKFADNTFDAVLSITAFEFIKKPEKVYAELYRVLKPGGQLLIGTICRDSKWGEFYHQKSRSDNKSVFQFAELKTRRQMEDLDRKNLLDSRECLFIPPYAENNMFNRVEEKKLSNKERGGFICVLFQKPH